VLKDYSDIGNSFPMTLERTRYVLETEGNTTKMVTRVNYAL